MNAVEMLSTVEVCEHGTWGARLMMACDDERPAEFTDAAWTRELAFAVWFQRDRGGGKAHVLHRVPRE